MAFPESPRIVYQRNPLLAVICQLRFPPILKIETQTPAGFQERIRQEYPLFQERRNEGALALPPEILKAMGEDASNLLGSFAVAGMKAYDFATPDQAWRVSLTRDFMAFTSRRYTRWEDFRARLVRVIDALNEEYSPSFCVRIGLRYQNAIKRLDLRLGESPWADLLRPHIAGTLASDEVSSLVQRVATDVAMRVEDWNVRIRHGFAVQGEAVDPNVYVIDSDFFAEERTEVSHAVERLDHFNREAGRLFRWAIKDRLHEAMGPTGI